MDSSRMRTIGSSSHVYPSMHWAQGVFAQGGICPGEASARGRGVCPGGAGYLPKGGCIPVCTEVDTIPLWTEFLTHSCENITLPQLHCGR